MPEDLQKSYKLSQRKYEFWETLNDSLLFTNIGISMTPNIEEMQKIDMIHFIYFDAFSRDRLFIQ